MNKTKIETCDYTWNIVTGCWGPGGTAEKPNRCPYCYAWKMAGRFLPGSTGGPEAARYDPFAPKLHPDRLSQPSRVKKPSKIFVCSMADLFGDWVSKYWIKAVLYRMEQCPQHIFQFLTKNPKRLKDFNPWPSNCWVGTTVTNQADADELLPWLARVEATVRFVSHEPLLGPIGLPAAIRVPVPGMDGENFLFPLGGTIQWAILGSMTGPGAVKWGRTPSPSNSSLPEWVAALANQYHDAGVPIFMKNNLRPPMGRLVQEWPCLT